MKNFNLIKFKMADLRPLPIDKFSRYRDSLNFFYVLLQNLYHISISPIAQMCLKLSRFGQKLGHGGQNDRLSAIIFVICVISEKPDQIARPLLLRKCSFRWGYTVRKFNLDQIKNGRPATTFEFNMRNSWKTVADSYNITIKKNVRFL